MLSGLALAARIIPSKNGSLLIDGKEVNAFKSEMPLPDGKLVTCKGTCLVQANNMQLVAQDKAVFALSEASQQYGLTVESGRLDFAIGTESKTLVFKTPHHTIPSERNIMPAGDSRLIRGYVLVTEKGTEISTTEGAIQIATGQGSQLIEPGHPLVIASNGDAQAVAAVGAATTAAGGAALAGASGAGASSGAVAAAAGSFSAAGIAAGMAASAGDGGRQELSPTDINPSNLDTRPF
jgi:hypothetical protein